MDKLRLPTKKRRAFLDHATKTYADNREDERLLKFLATRGISPETASRWWLGYVKDPLPGHEAYRGRLCLPYLTPEAGPVAMVFRCLHESGSPDCKHPKYLAEEGQYRPLFGVRNLSHGVDTLYLCEGELDAIVATESGFPAIAVPGAKRWQEWWDYMFDGYSDVVVLADGDDAGKRLAARVCDRVRHARVVSMPDREDVSSFVAANGHEALKRLVVSVEE